MELNNLSNLTSKEVRYAIKKHITPEELCRKYNCTEAELKKRIGNLFKSERDCDDVTKQLCAARRYPKKQAAKKEETAITDNPKVVDNAQVSGTALVFDNTRPETGAAQPSDELTELKIQESNLSMDVMKLENDHVALANEHRSIIKDLRALESKLTELRAQLISIGEEYEAIVTESNRIVSQMNELSSEIYAKRSELDQMRARIRTLEQVTIAVTFDGIELFAGPDITLDDSGFEELARELFDHSELCADLRKRDIQLLARVIKVVEHADRPIEAIFDNPELEAVYELYLEPASDEAS